MALGRLHRYYDLNERTMHSILQINKLSKDYRITLHSALLVGLFPYFPAKITHNEHSYFFEYVDADGLQATQIANDIVSFARDRFGKELSRDN